MQQTADSIFSFGEFEVDSAKRLLLKRGQSVHLKSKAFDLLLNLIDHRGEILSKNDLLDLVWKNQFVEENNLTVHVAALRKALGETKDEHRFIVTVPGRGYRFVGKLNGQHHNGNISENQIVPETTEEESVKNKSKEQIHSSHNRPVVIGLISAVLLLLVGSGSYFLYNRRINSTTAAPFQNFTIKRLTTDGKSTNAALSPDGKLFVYSHIDGEMQSLWLGHVDGGDPKQLVAPSPLRYFSARFTPDASSIYFGSGEESGERATYKIPVFGGVPEKVADDAYVITFAPDGKRFAFVRRDPASKKTRLIASDATGKNAIELAAPPDNTDFVSQSVAWSPDGTKIAVGASHPETDTIYNILTINVSDGAAKWLTNQNWSTIGAISWLANGNWLIANAQKQDTNHRQLWSVSYPEGEVQHIVNDLNLYGSMSTAATQNVMIAIQAQAESNIWVASAADLAHAEQITASSIGRRDGTVGVEWTVDGRIIYTAEIDGNNTIWIMNSDGTDQKQLISSEGNNIYPSLTADNRHIVFDSNRAGKYAVWIANLDGGGMRQLTDTGVAGQPHVSPDGKWVAYISDFENSGELWRISTAGGEPVKLADKASWVRISPDSRFIACGYESGGTKIAIFSMDGGEPIKLFDVPRLANLRLGVRWTPDGKAVTYRDWVNGIWRQNLDGGEPRRLKGLPNEKLYAYDWSSDGKRFAFTRGAETRDVVLINNSN